MTPEKQIYAYPIPNSFFKPHNVVRTFYAKVIYTVDGSKVNIEEVGLSPKCLKYINDTAGLANKIEDKLNVEVKKAISLNNLNKTIASTLAPYIK
jgi:hypothetical protein